MTIWEECGVLGVFFYTIHQGFWWIVFFNEEGWMMAEIAFPIFFILIGLLVIISTIKEFDFFMNSRKALVMQRLIGRRGTKVFYITTGILLLFLGVFMLVHGVPVSDAAP